jgi:hypothetical protein
MKPRKFKKREQRELHIKCFVVFHIKILNLEIPPIMVLKGITACISKRKILKWQRTEPCIKAVQTKVLYFFQLFSISLFQYNNFK